VEIFILKKICFAKSLFSSLLFSLGPLKVEG
jgi:hypothetical protein